MRYVVISLFVLFVGFNNVKSTSAIECLPTCDETDVKFLTIAGTALSTIAGAEIVVDLVSNGDNLEFGIFDGDAAGLWDVWGGEAIEIELILELHADPLGDSSGLASPPIAFWTSDGTIGQNIGEPMVDNDWSDFTFANVPQAQGANGDFIYSLRITPINPMLGGFVENNFKIRTQNIMYVPAMFPITFISNIFSPENPDDILVMFSILYPNSEIDLETGSVCGLPPGELCDFNDPSCCLFETTYDGIWSFFMEVPEGEVDLTVYDGDLDYGDLAGTVFDTDDPNSLPAPFLPPWSAGTDVVPQTARPANPFDNNGNSSEVFFVKDPSVTYFLIDPQGNAYQNFNPSGDREWEVFRISTLTSDPTVAEFMVDDIPAGRWEVRLIGVDSSNLNSIVLPFDLRGVEDDSPVDPPTQVPTLNEWGLMTLAFFGLLISVLYLKRRKNVEMNV